MRIQNVKDSRRFFRFLAQCTGLVTAVNEAGMHIILTNGNKSPEMLPMTYMDGEIRNLDLKFEKPEDCQRILNYLIKCK